jgi:hypothetical protein
MHKATALPKKLTKIYNVLKILDTEFISIISLHCEIIQNMSKCATNICMCACTCIRVFPTRNCLLFTIILDKHQYLIQVKAFLVVMPSGVVAGYCNTIWQLHDLNLHHHENFGPYNVTDHSNSGRVIKLTVVIIEESHPYQLHTKLYPTVFSQGLLHAKTRLLSIIRADFDNRQTTDQVFCLCQIMQKRWEFNNCRLKKAHEKYCTTFSLNLVFFIF